MNTTIPAHVLGRLDTTTTWATPPLPTLLGAALSAAGTAALLVSVATGPASAIPVPDHGPGPIVVGITAPAQDRPCFMVRANWNDALDGPQPRC